MSISVVTKEDLHELKEYISESVTSILKEHFSNTVKEPDLVLLKSHQVQRMLGISPGTLQNMRVNGTLPFSKVGGVIFYDKQDILNIIEDNKQNV